MLDTGFVWILIATGIYGLLHSLMASLGAKALAERLLEDIARRFYRLFYVIFVSVTLLPVLALQSGLAAPHTPWARWFGAQPMG
jgi:hypothetical protein